MNYEDMTGEQFLDKIEEMFPLFDGLDKRESTDEQSQNDLKAVMLSILDSIPHAVIGLRDRRIIFANHAVELVFGWKIEELIDKTTRVLYRSDEEYEEIASYAYPALEKQRTYSRDFHCRHKDGRDIVCLVSSSRVGEILKDRMIVVTYSDITEQKQAKESLRLLNLYNRSLLETCLDPLVVIDPAGKISDVNAATEKITGYLRKELIGTDVARYFTDTERVKAEYRRVFKEGAVYNYPLEIRHREGRVTPVLYSASVYRDESDNVVGIFAAARDITERKRMMEALRESERRYRSVVEDQTELICRFRSDYTLTFVNEAYCRFSDKKRDDLIGHKFMAFIPEGDRQRVEDQISSLSLQNPVATHEQRVFMPDGTIGWQQWTNRAILDGNETLVEYQAVGRDITDRKRAEDALREHEAHLEKLVEERTTELKKTASLLQQEVIERKHGEERLRNARARLLTVLDGLNASVYVVDMNTYEVLYINKHMKNLFGDVTGKICWQSILNQPGPCDFCVDERLLTPEAESSGVHIWEQYHAALGIWILIQDQVIQWMDGRMVRLKIATNISKRKLAEQAVQKIQIQQKAILDNIPDMAWLKDRESRYIAVNEAFGKACGLKPEDVVGLIDPDIWPAELAEKYREDDKKVIECGTRKQVEEPLVEKDGREIWMETIKTPIFNDENETIGTAGIARDITRRKRAEEEVKKRERELEAKSRNLEEVNIALKVLLKRREEDKSELEENVLSNVKALIEPYFDKLKKTRLSSDQITYVSVIEAHLNDIISPFLRDLTSKYLNLTPREIQIANLIKEGKTTKEIAELLNSSQGAVDFHRNNIRNKLHLKNKKTNLRSYLSTLS